MYYRLTPKMQQEFRQRLRKFHDLFDGIRCDSWGLEELIYKSIQSDNTVNHHAIWTGRKHDDKADIRVKVNGREHELQIKSGQFLKNGSLKLSAHRLGRFDKGETEITNYLNSRKYEVLSVPYRKVDNETGRHHIYRIVYIDKHYFGQLNKSDWKKTPTGKTWKQENPHGILYTINTGLSWQVWWKIPEPLLNMLEEFVIGY